MAAQSFLASPRTARNDPLPSLRKASGTVESLLSLLAALALRLQVSDAVELRLVPVESETGVLLYSPSDMPHPRGEIRRKAEGPLSLFPCPCPLDAPYLYPQFPYSYSCMPGEIVVRRKDGVRTSYWNRPDLDAEK